MPKAVTTAQKLQMQGKPVNVSNIQNQVYNVVGPERVRHSSLSTLVSVLVKIFMVFIIGIFAFIIIMVFGSLFGGGAILLQAKDYIFKDGHEMMLANFGWLLFCLAPIAIIIVALVRRFSSQQYFSGKIYGYLGLGWLFGLFCLIGLSRELRQDFSAKHTNQETPVSFTMAKNCITINSFEKFTNTSSRSINGIQFNKDSFIIGNVTLEVKPSIDAQFRYATTIESNGADIEEAKKYCKQIGGFTPTITDSVVTFPAGVVLKNGQVWRGQKVKVILYVPEGKQIRFAQNVETNYLNVDVNTNFPNLNFNISSPFMYQTNKTYSMKNGELKLDPGQQTSKVDVDDLNESVQTVANDIAEITNEANTAIKEKIDELQTELNDEDNELSAADKAKLKEQLKNLQTGLDSVVSGVTLGKKELLKELSKKLNDIKVNIDTTN